VRSQTSQVYEEIKKRIIDGTYHPSETLTELALASEFSVSRNTVKKALLMLQSDKLVVIEESKRARVRSFSLEEMTQYLSLRELIESFVVRESVPFLTEGDLSEMHGILDEMERCYNEHNLLEYSKNNWRFHDVIYRACPNRPAVEMTLAIKNQFKRFNVRTILIPGRDNNSFSEHKAIMDALDQRDAATAATMMGMHIANMADILKKNYSILF